MIEGYQYYFRHGLQPERTTFKQVVPDHLISTETVVFEPINDGVDIPSITTSQPFYTEGFKELLEGRGERLTIPRIFLYGTQELGEYSEENRRSIEGLLQEHGKSFLEQNPILVCAIPHQTGMTLAIIDGHHRARYSGKFHINEIPSIVLTPDELADIKNKHNQTKGNGKPPTTGDLVAKELLHSIAIAAESFSRRMPPEKKSHPIPEVTSIPQLKQRLAA